MIKQESRAYFRTLGIRISVLRKERGMTQAELARALGVSQQSVFAYELGDRRVSVLMLIKLANVFGIVVEELMGLMGSPRPARRLSPAGIRHADRFQQLSKTEQRFVKRIIDVLLEKGSPRRDQCAGDVTTNSVQTCEKDKRAERVSAARSIMPQRPKQNETSHERH